MKPSLLILIVLVLAPTTFAANDNRTADRAWTPFFVAFRAAVTKRDRAALRTMMSPDFYSSPGNDAGPDAAFEFWDDPNVRGWNTLNLVLSRGSVPLAAWWNNGQKPKHISRVAPPKANSKRRLRNGDWYAIFEFRDGRWYCTVFNQCCD